MQNMRTRFQYAEYALPTLLMYIPAYTWYIPGMTVHSLFQPPILLAVALVALLIGTHLRSEMWIWGDGTLPSSATRATWWSIHSEYTMYIPCIYIVYYRHIWNIFHVCNEYITNIYIGYTEYIHVIYLIYTIYMYSISDVYTK